MRLWEFKVYQMINLIHRRGGRRSLMTQNWEIEVSYTRAINFSS